VPLGKVEVEILGAVPTLGLVPLSTTQPSQLVDTIANTVDNITIRPKLFILIAPLIKLK
jgi:hypothetical protein